MKKQDNFYITTAIDYPSGPPHMGHAYEKLTADAIARWNRLQGKKVFFLTGTDEHGFKIQRTAKKAGMAPREFVEMQVPKFKELCEKWNISHNRFIRTTDRDHEELAKKIFQRVYDKGDIYLGKYEGHYCGECETFYLEKDLNNGKCITHDKKCEWLEEESYFFKMSRYEKRLREYFAKKATVLPEEKKEEMLGRMKQGLKDLSVSRKALEWGIPVPFDSGSKIYVWFDALLNYVSGIGFDGRGKNEFWPADVHLIGKDILWHHSVIWWSILMAAEFELPKTVFVHGFINTDSGEKMSKSRGNVIDPLKLAEQYNVDSLRYFLLREIPFGSDGNFSEKKLIERHNNELANELGNLVFRVLSLLEKNYQGKIPKGTADKKLMEKLDRKKIFSLMEKYELHLALNEIMMFVKECNKFVNEKEPWRKEGKELENILYSLADVLRITAILIEAFMPATSEKIFNQLGIERQSFRELEFNLTKTGTKTEKKEVLFKKIQ